MKNYDTYHRIDQVIDLFIINRTQQGFSMASYCSREGIQIVQDHFQITVHRTVFSQIGNHSSSLTALFVSQ